MVRIARERISTLFALAEGEATRGELALADRYVTLARKVGTRYNVRLLPEYRELYCRGCSTFWVEGRTVRTRLRSRRRVRTCLKCGRARRTPVRWRDVPRGGGPAASRPLVPREEGALVAPEGADEGESDLDDGSEEE